MTKGVHDYGWKQAHAPHSCDYLAPQVLALLGSKGIKRVCDLGSGNGALVGELLASGYSACGVEYDQKGCEIARRQYPAANFYNLGVQDDPDVVVAAEGLFDAVVSTEVIEHLFSPHLLPQFARALLRENGKLIVTTPYHGYLKNLALSVAGKWDHHHTALWHGGHIKFFSRTTLTKLLEENGFRVVAFHGVGRAPYLWKSMMLECEAI